MNDIATLSVHSLPGEDQGRGVVSRKEPAWITLERMSRFFGLDESTVSRYIRDLIRDDGLEETEVVRYTVTAADGKTNQVTYYT